MDLKFKYHLFNCSFVWIKFRNKGEIYHTRINQNQKKVKIMKKAKHEFIGIESIKKLHRSHKQGI